MNPQYHLISAVVPGELGDPATAAPIELVRRHAPHLFRHTRAEIALRVGRAEDADRFMASLARVGLPAGR